MHRLAIGRIELANREPQRSFAKARMKVKVMGALAQLEGFIFSTKVFYTKSDLPTQHTAQFVNADRAGNYVWLNA
ncbi:hypothetical protein Slin14017_G068630 [Septoria linicola]|nr:hypothetical protein Slin14017_G068630 [Septoria linicola]